MTNVSLLMSEVMTPPTVTYAALKIMGVLTPVERGELVLKVAVRLKRAGDKAHGTGADAERARPLLVRCIHIVAQRQPQVGVGVHGG